MFEHLRSSGIDSKELIPPSYVAWWALYENMVFVPACQLHSWRNRFLGIDSWAP
jgi:hypothetical protein